MRIKVPFRLGIAPAVLVAALLVTPQPQGALAQQTNKLKFQATWLAG